jgi:hypothetical protein
MVRDSRPGSIERRCQEEFIFHYFNYLHPDRAIVFDDDAIAEHKADDDISAYCY